MYNADVFMLNLCYFGSIKLNLRIKSSTVFNASPFYNTVNSFEYLKILENVHFVDAFCSYFR